MSRDKVLLIIPAYNEEASISKLCQQIKKTSYDYVVINDGSTDSTADILDKNHFNHIDLVHNLGIGGAVQTGYKYALENNYDIAVQVDADGQHDIEYVKKVIQPIIDKKTNLVIGSRFTDRTLNNFFSTPMRRCGIKMLSNTIRFFSGKRIYDVTSGFRAADKEVIKKFAEDYPLEYPEPVSEFELLKSGYKLKEVSVKMHERNGGKSSIHTWKNGYYMLNVILSIILVQLRSKKDV